MTDRLREQVSALADARLPEGEHELLLRRFAVDKALRVCWERYHLIGEAMRNGLPQADTRGFADRVMAEISGQPASDQQTAAFPGTVRRAVVGIAVAASVAVIAVAGLRHDARLQQTAVAPAEIVPAATALQPDPLSYGLVNSASWEGSAPQIQASLRGYLVNHDLIMASQPHPGTLSAGLEDGAASKPPVHKHKKPKDQQPPRQP